MLDVVNINHFPSLWAKPIVIRTKETDGVIEAGETSVPVLLEILGSSRPKRIGLAAFCLQEIGSNKGIGLAHIQIRELSRLQPSQDRNFALGALRDYVASITKASY